MSNNPHWAIADINASLNALLSPQNGGFVEVYSTATSQPANPDTAIGGGSILLFTCDLSATAYGSATGGVATANTIAAGTAVATGTASWFRVYASNGTTGKMDGSVGTVSGFDLILLSTAVVTGMVYTPTSLTVTQTQ